MQFAQKLHSIEEMEKNRIEFYRRFEEDRMNDKRIEEFKEKYPEYSNERFEICDNGDVYVHGNCAYPLIIRGAVKTIEEV